MFKTSCFCVVLMYIRLVPSQVLHHSSLYIHLLSCDLCILLFCHVVFLKRRVIVIDITSA